eukprot:4356920-Prymnesium_polylepis.1
MTNARRSTWTKHVAGAATLPIFMTAKSPTATGRTSAGVPAGGEARKIADAVRNLTMAAAILGVKFKPVWLANLPAKLAILRSITRPTICDGATPCARPTRKAR